MNSEARVCILMPVQNNGKNILESLQSLINQTYQNTKILVVDDGSVDNTSQAIRKIKHPRLHVLRFKNKIGLVHSLNWAISEVDEEYIVMAHENMISVPERIEKLVSFLDSNPDVGICGSRVEGTEEKIPVTDAEIRASLLFCNAISHETIIMRSSLLKENGFRYRDKYPGMADYDLWFRLMPATKFGNINEALVKNLPHEQPTDHHFSYSRTEAASMFVEKFTQMGIQPAEKELLVHLDLCKLEKVRQFSSPPRYKAWMDKLLQLNKSKKLFPQDELEMIIAEKWKLLYPFVLKENSKRIRDYLKIEGLSRLDIYKFILKHKLKDIFHI